MKKVNYLNNRDLLSEIHKSKNTYSSYVNPEDSQYDMIVNDIKKINGANIARARKIHAKRLTAEAWDQAKKTGNKRIKMSDYEVSPRKIKKTDLVFRVMTFDHITTDSERKKNPKTRADHHTKVNFPHHTSCGNKIRRGNHSRPNSKSRLNKGTPAGFVHHCILYFIWLTTEGP